MSERDNPDILGILKHNFGKPRVMTWGWPLMIVSLVTAVFFTIRCLLNRTDLAVPVTSLSGCSVLMILLTICALIFPSVLFSRDFSEKVTGRYTGVGALLLGLISGIPLMMVKTALYNAISYLTLRLGEKSVFPVFFHSQPETTYGLVLEIISDIIIPAFGISLFFFGFLWSRFKSFDRRKAYVVISIAVVLYSMDFTAALATGAAAVWCCYLRSKVHNIWAPFLCMVSSGICELFVPEYLSKIDIFSVQTYADIGSTYFYSSIPAFFMGMVLILFFIRVLDSFSVSLRYEIDITEDDEFIPAFDKSINLSLILTIAVYITIWVLIIKGVQL